MPMREARRWTIPDASDPGGTITIAGWDFGGHGPIALLHHANGMCGALWEPLAHKLTEHYRIFAIDARGHGDSDARVAPEGYEWDYFVEDLANVARALMDEFAVEQIEYGIGSSFGGILTAAVEALYPGTYKRVAMLDPPVHPKAEALAKFGMDPGVEPPPSQKAERVSQTRRRRVVWPSRDVIRDAWHGKPLFAAWLDEAFEIYLADGFRDLPSGEVELKCHPSVEAHIFETTGSLETTEFAPEVKAPVLFAHASRGFFPPEYFRRVAGLFPRGEFVEIDAGHLLPLEVPEQCATELERFAEG